MADRPRLIVLEGPDGVGKTHHARAAAEALCRTGTPAAWYHHPKPSPGLRDPWAIALHYASERAALRLLLDSGWHDNVCVMVCDRWWPSTQMLGLVLDDDALGSLAEAECRKVGHPDLTVVLTAPDVVLDARLAARGTPATDHDREVRRTYESTARTRSLPVVDTSASTETVTARLVELVRGVLG